MPASKYIVSLFIFLFASKLYAQPGDIWKKLPEVREYLDSASTQEGFSGVVLIGRDEKEILHQAYGFAEAEHRVKMRVNHLFRIGSLTKPITASAVLAAVEEGRLSLGDSVCDFLTTCPESWKEVTIRQLLSHSSGIKDHFGDLEAVPVEKTVKELQRVIGAVSQNEALISKPGTTYAYSNFNYVLLGAVLENVMDTTWETALSELVFKPLELKTMRYDDVYAIVQDRVRGYRTDESGRLLNIEYDDHAAYAAGGLLSGSADLFRWSRGVLNKRLYGSELVNESLTPFLDNYGYGWQIREFFDRQIYNHTGGIDGFSSYLAFYPDYELTIIVLSNIENDPAILRGCDIAGRLFGWNWPDSDGDELTPRQRCGVEN